MTQILKTKLAKFQWIKDTYTEAQDECIASRTVFVTDDLEDALPRAIIAEGRPSQGWEKPFATRILTRDDPEDGEGKGFDSLEEAIAYCEQIMFVTEEEKKEEPVYNLHLQAIDTKNKTAHISIEIGDIYRQDDAQKIWSGFVQPEGIQDAARQLDAEI